MSADVNPYAPPQNEPPQQSWWSRVRRTLIAGFTRRTLVGPPNFAKGDPIICGGIAYFIDPDDSKTLYAGSPSSTRSDDRFSLIIAEAIRHLPEFLTLHGQAMPSVADRRMVVRIVDDYTGIYADYSRAVEALAAPLTASTPSQDGCEPCQSG